jgi:hypothetical protein
MREIDKIGHTPAVSLGKKITPDAPRDFIEAAQRPEVKDLLNNPGLQAMVRHDNVAEDTAYFDKYPERVERAHKIVDALIDKGVHYEEAAVFIDDLLRR